MVVIVVFTWRVFTLRHACFAFVNETAQGHGGSLDSRKWKFKCFASVQAFCACAERQPATTIQLQRLDVIDWILARTMSNLAVQIFMPNKSVSGPHSNLSCRIGLLLRCSRWKSSFLAKLGGFLPATRSWILQRWRFCQVFRADGHGPFGVLNCWAYFIPRSQTRNQEKHGSFSGQILKKI